MCGGGVYFVLFFFKQKTAYEMRISDWSSDVCSSDLLRAHLVERRELHRTGVLDFDDVPTELRLHRQCGQAFAGIGQRRAGGLGEQIGRASCRERVCQYV